MAELRDDPRLAEARAVPIADVADRLRLDGLRKAGSEMVGPCPVCGGRDRFSINAARGVFHCRRCDAGGDGLALVRHVKGCDFVAALDWLMGARDVALDPEEAARRKEKADAEMAAREAEAERYRARAIEAARRIWRGAGPAEGTPVRGYLARRGIGVGALPALPPSIRYAPDLPYWRVVDGEGREWHRGPAMVCAVQRPDGRLGAVHMTWFDLDRPNGKAEIVANGAPQPAKLVRGSKKGGAIRLGGSDRSPVLVMGEGVETTLTARIAAEPEGAAYWAGVDLGNMGGRRRQGPGLRYAGLPDMADDEAWLPPPWVRRLIFVQDGDSDPRATRAILESGLRRAMATVPGLVGQIVHAGAGVDLNDVLLRGEGAA